MIIPKHSGERKEGIIWCFINSALSIQDINDHTGKVAEEWIALNLLN
jgi:hypothetical protein